MTVRVETFQADPARAAVEARARFRKKTSLFIGTQYFRPPNPRAESFDRDLQLMRSTGLKLAKLWLYWSTVNPRPDVWDFSAYDALFDAASRHDMKLLVQLITESPPAWLEGKYPQYRYVDANERPIPFQSIFCVQVGGYPGICFHNVGARAALEEYIQRAADYCRRRAEVQIYDVWNEIWLPECHCPATQERYRDHLRQKYADIDALNEAYGGATYSEFSQIGIPPDTAIKASLARRFDYFEFMREVKTARMRWLVATLAARDAERTIVAHTQNAHILGTTGLDWDSDPWDLAVPLDKWGVSSYIGEVTVDPEHPVVLRLGRRELHRIALQLNVTRDSAGGKPWWLAEHTAGDVWHGYGSARRSPNETTLKTLLAFSFGAESSVYWQWRSEIFGEEAPSFGLTDLAGAPTRQSEAVARICRLLEEQRAIFDSMTWPQPEVGLLWDQRSAYFARCTKDTLGSRNFEGLYAALIDNGYSVAILNARQLAASGVPEAIKVLFAPVQHFDRPGLSDKLAEWVRGGGTLVGGPLFQLFRSDLFVNESFPPVPMDEVFGARHRRREYLEQAEGGALPGERWVETYTLDGAEALAISEGHPILTHHRFGAGHAVLCGSFVAARYRDVESRRVRDFVDRMASLGGVEPEAHVTDECLVRVARCAVGTVAFVFNCTDKPMQCDVAVPSAGQVARDLLSGVQYKRSGVESFHIALEPKGSSILLIDIPAKRADRP